ncbi:uncharacterized protein CCOS01_08199 [Colletotrichum costaricense]|uniref:Uncharacterized protein n=1 Tax=Colletotrichum costaricense TaxID=1209916 RepID=A0AAI9YV65_9PEZI|nr:uncharacterized protein CCOS01_08199 [Colletotrichum costaricense]KAK1525781.1 hypothetical protein CCOS01_08199 [Colletotrichum costaricense]
MALPSLWVCLYLLFAVFVAAENRFRRPPGPGLAYDYRDNNAYTIGDIIDLHWDMEYDSARLILWQESVGGGSTLDYIDVVASTSAKSINWEVSIKDFPNPKLSNLYFFELLGPGKEPANWGVTCHYFNITEAQVIPQPSNNSAATPLPTTKDQGLSSGAAAGIAVGVTFAAVLGVGTIGWLLWRRRQARKTPIAQAEKKHSLDGSQQQQYHYAQAPGWQPELPVEGHGLYEISASSMNVRYEMASHQGIGQAEFGDDRPKAFADMR